LVEVEASRDYFASRVSAAAVAEAETADVLVKRPQTLPIDSKSKQMR
jgi:hypothetical protein